LRSFFQFTEVLDIKEVEREGKRQALSSSFQQSDLFPSLSPDFPFQRFSLLCVFIFEMFRLMFSPEK
jgi:hypothetical protein